MGGDARADRGAGLPRLRLDELLEELQGRIDEVRGTRDRLNGLLEAVMSVGRNSTCRRFCAGLSRPPSPWSTPSTGPWG